MVPLMNPAAGSRGVGQRNGDGHAAGVAHLVLPSNELLEGQRFEKSRYCKLADGNDQSRSDETELPFEPLGAVRPLGP